MTKHIRLTHLHAPQPGISLTEYAILIGLIGVVSIVGLQSLGGALHELLSNTGTNLKSNNTLSVLNPVASASTPSAKLTLKGKKYYSIVIDPETGKPTLQLSAGANGISVNTTSTDGNFNTLGSMMLAKALNQLADNEPDPVKKAYYTQLADLSFYLGGAEGEMDSVPNLDLGDNDGKGTYTRGDALRDINAYQKQLKKLINNPPDSLSKSELLTVLPFATDAYNISQNYLNTYGKFLRSDGSVPENFGVASKCQSNGTCPAGDGTPGSALANADKTEFLPQAVNMINKPYHQLRSCNQIRAAANTVLTTNNVESVQVKSTLTDATSIDAQSVNRIKTSRY